MTVKYDLHLHSCLSPCGDNDMTPCNLVQMAKLYELDMIALTDHNTTGNCRSAVAVGEEIGLTVVPGMELCTAEEIHVVCLFPDCDMADKFNANIRTTVPPVKNKPDIFGQQLYMDTEDNVVGTEDILLLTASSVSIDTVVELVKCYDGVCYPAHIDRSSFSVLSVLGEITPEMGFSCAEVSRTGSRTEMREQNPILNGMRIMRSSDAHYLQDMGAASDTLELPENTAKALIEYLSAPLQTSDCRSCRDGQTI